MELALPTQYHFEKAEIKGVDSEVIALIQEFHVFENINKGSIEGYVVISDSDAAGLISDYGLEFTEDFSFSFRNSLDETYTIDAVFNGIESEMINGNHKVYKVAFISKAGRMNQTTKRYYGCIDNRSPFNIAIDMAERLDSKIDIQGTDGEPVYMMGGGRTPLDVMKFICQKSVVKGETDVKVEEGESESSSSGTTGYYFWETIDGFRFCSIKELHDVSNPQYGEFNDYEFHIANIDRDLQSKVKSILSHEFPAIGDIQSKLEIGAFSSKMFSFDIDSGETKEILFQDPTILTDKMRDIIDEPTRYFTMAFENEFKNDECDKASDNTFDMSRKFTQQYAANVNTAQDQHGRFEMPCRFTMRAGDTFEVRIGKIAAESVPEFDKKHSGKYLIKQVGHHMFINGHGYTKIATVRTTTQQMDE